MFIFFDTIILRSASDAFRVFQNSAGRINCCSITPRTALLLHSIPGRFRALSERSALVRHKYRFELTPVDMLEEVIKAELSSAEMGIETDQEHLYFSVGTVHLPESCFLKIARIAGRG